MMRIEDGVREVLRGSLQGRWSVQPERRIARERRRAAAPLPAREYPDDLLNVLDGRRLVELNSDRIFIVAKVDSCGARRRPNGRDISADDPQRIEVRAIRLAIAE